jgi:Ala-tRNA(Pro) deacylase
MMQLRGIPFEELHHSEVYTAQEVAQREHFSGHHMAKVVVVMVDGRPVELILPASRRVVLPWVKEIFDAKEVRLATEKEMEQFFTSEVGALPALRQVKNVEVVMDPSLIADGDILFQAGTHRDAIRLNFDDWYELVQPTIEPFTELPGFTALVAPAASRLS